MPHAIRMQIALTAPLERVYHALTDSRALEAWFCEAADVSWDAKHYDFWGRFTPDAPDREQGRHLFTDLIENRQVGYRWRVRQADTQVTFKLLPRDTGTILTLRHQNMADSDEPMGVAGIDDFWFLSLENLRRYVDGKPSEARIDFTSPMRGDITCTTEIEASAERVFEVLLRPDEVDRWIATRATIQPEVGGAYNLGWGEDLSAVKIVSLVPNQTLAYQWDESSDPSQPRHRIVTWTLEGSGGKTRLTFVQSGFAPDEDVSGVYMGWHNYVNWVRSLAEYGAAWQPPLLALPPNPIAYPASMINAQDQLVPELLQ
jgi:uncharacterized protein YndB with AHSA1/START domain